MNPADGNTIRPSISVEDREDATSAMQESRRQSHEIEMLRARLSEYDTMRFAMVNGGKNSLRKNKTDIMSPLDKMNLKEVNHCIKEVLFPHLKINPKGWHKYNDNRRTLCQRIMAVVTLPAGVEKVDYWNKLVVLLSNEKFCAIRSNFKKGCLTEYEGMYIVIMVINIICAHIICLFYDIHQSTIADRTKGQTIEVDDDSGKIFLTLRSMEADALLGLTYDDVEPLLRFIDKYVSVNHGQRAIAKYVKMQPNKTLLDKLTDADIAYTILVYESSQAVWENDLLKKECHDEEQLQEWQSVSPKYHVKKGTRMPRFGEGWTDEGRAYFVELKVEIGRLRSVESFWHSLGEHWKTYAKKYNRVYYERGNVIQAVVEGGGSDDLGDDDDCAIDLPGDAPLFDVADPQLFEA